MRQKQSRSGYLSPFYFQRFEAGFIRPDDAAALFGVTLRTIRTWDQHGAPFCATRLLSLLNGDLGALWSEWQGWQIRRDGLKGPGKLRISLEQLRGLPNTLDAYNAALRRLETLQRQPLVRLLRWAERLWRQ